MIKIRRLIIHSVWNGNQMLDFYGLTVKIVIGIFISKETIERTASINLKLDTKENALVMGKTMSPRKKAHKSHVRYLIELVIIIHTSLKRTSLVGQISSFH